MYTIILLSLLIATPLIAADTAPKELPKKTNAQNIPSNKEKKRKKKYLGIVARGAGRMIPQRASYVRI